MLSKRLTEVDVSTILTILQCTCGDNLLLVFLVVGFNYIVIFSKIWLVMSYEFFKTFWSLWGHMLLGLLLSFLFLVERKMTKKAIWAQILLHIIFFGVSLWCPFLMFLCQVVHYFGCVNSLWNEIEGWRPCRHEGLHSFCSAKGAGTEGFHRRWEIKYNWEKSRLIIELLKV